MKKNFVLIGIPSCGKTTLGKQAADVLGMDFVDTDTPTAKNLIAEDFLLPQMFTVAGQRAFLRTQNEVIENLRALQTPTIIATGAEASLSAENLHILREIGWIIHIRRNPDLIFEHMHKLPDEERGLRLVNTDTGEKIYLNESCLKGYLECIPQYDEIADTAIVNEGEISEGLENLLAAIQAYRQQA
jgi:shikimate kinase